MTLPCHKKLSGLLSVKTSNYDVFFFELPSFVYNEKET